MVVESIYDGMYAVSVQMTFFTAHQEHEILEGSPTIFQPRKPIFQSSTWRLYQQEQALRL